jgi:hypothetical protein
VLGLQRQSTNFLTVKLSVFSNLAAAGEGRGGAKSEPTNAIGQKEKGLGLALLRRLATGGRFLLRGGFLRCGLLLRWLLLRCCHDVPPLGLADGSNNSSYIRSSNRTYRI